MKYSEYNDSIRSRKEKILMVLHVICISAMAVIAIESGWGAGIVVCIVTPGIILSLATIFKVKNYKFRTYLTIILVQFSLLIYVMNVKSLFAVTSTIVVLVVGASLYEIKEPLLITMGNTTFMLIYHLMFKKSVDFGSTVEAIRYIFQYSSIFVVQAIMYYIVKKQNERHSQLVEIIKELKNAEKSKDEFLANVSHEIRTPVNTICGMSDIVLRSDIPEDVREEINNIQISGKNLTSVVTDILDFSELQAGKMEILCENYNIMSTIEDVISMANIKIEKKNIEFIVNLDGSLPSELYGDEQKIKRVIMNIVNNAIKFTQEGCVSLIVSYRKEEYGINLCITVKDTGKGMEKEILEKIFTSFNQADTKMNRSEGGIGLGLAISSTIIKKMGGTLMVNSVMDKGTTVKIVIPQQVVNEEECIRVENAEDIKGAIFIDMEQFSMLTIRDEYSNYLKDIIKSLNVKCHVCMKLSELKRRDERENYTHIVVTYHEYIQDMDYFDKLSQVKKVLVIVTKYEERCIKNERIINVVKPFFVRDISKILNEISKTEENFIAPSAKVLVVDDNNMNLKVAEGMLKKYRIQAAYAESGMQALNMLKENTEYDLILLDYMMPEMDGIEVFKNIRKLQGNYYKNIPIIALTANAVAGAKEMFLKEGFNDFISKPIERSVLDRVLLRNIPKNKILYIEENEKTEVNNENSRLSVGGLDVNKGIIYCGGEEGFIEVVRMYVDSRNEKKKQIEDAFKNEDWKNYTIYVHGLKSSMYSIGATELSEMAKKLEMAGKNNNTDYIRENHGRLITEFDKVFETLATNEMFKLTDEDDNDAQMFDEIDNAEFEQILIEFEDAVFDFDEEKMMTYINKLENLKYKKYVLKKEILNVKIKVEKSDYMSAFETLKKIKMKMDE